MTGGEARGAAGTAAAGRPARDIPARERLIFPLDVPTFEEARDLVRALGEAVHFYKIGLQLLLAGGGFTGEFRGMVDWLAARGKRVFADVKIFDIPATVAGAVRQLAGQPVTFVTVHGNDAMLRAAVREKANVKVLAVTVLTSLDRADVEELGFRADPREIVLSRARRALEIGCDGVVSSGLEAAGIRDRLGEKLLVIVPGVRPVDNDEEPGDDQKRIVTLERAFRDGADYVVVGRPIRLADDPRAAAEAIQERIAMLFPA